ncbi:MAG TPA: CHAT domain-containing protein, partial [Candidatus Saccharimonadales bacterium]|nr:CHAT domain-containing protein [Candidatus Saccharimonadales bacterium]
LRALEPRYREAASELREAIWDPIARRIQGATILLVVPDGAIDLVNLAALPAPGDRYLVETGPLIQYLSAERDLIAPERPRAAGNGLLLVGGVDYGAVPAGGGADVHGSKPPACSPFASLRFPPLPGAGAEADAVARIWKEHESGAVAASGEVMRLAGAEATAPAFLAAAPGKAILHLATHGFVLEDTCATASAAEAPEDPMLLSGLAFAGANRRRDAKPLADDGLLTAEEIAATDLSHAQWAVLSACDTGVGEVLGGEGVLGLRRAFEIAGAGTLIMSLWNVRDEDATEWMTALYRARFESLRTAEAVRRASIEVLESRRRNGRSTHPAAWGAFVASGEWR